MQVLPGAGGLLLGYALLSTCSLLWCLDESVASGIASKAVYPIHNDWLTKCAPVL